MKPTVIDPKMTTRAEAYKLWMSAPNPMIPRWSATAGMMRIPASNWNPGENGAIWSCGQSGGFRNERSGFC